MSKYGIQLQHNSVKDKVRENITNQVLKRDGEINFSQDEATFTMND